MKAVIRINLHTDEGNNAREIGEILKDLSRTFLNSNIERISTSFVLKDGEGVDCGGVELDLHAPKYKE